jgi:hypothetical protein
MDRKALIFPVYVHPARATDAAASASASASPSPSAPADTQQRPRPSIRVPEHRAARRLLVRL